MAWLSILGLYNYDETVFEGLSLPTADDIPKGDYIAETPYVPDKDTLIAYMCMELAELPLVYSSPSAMRDMITVWSKVHFKEWTDLTATLNYQYNPIWNKDGTETRTIKGDLHQYYGGHTVGTSTDTTAENLSDVTGYDTNAYSPNTRDTMRTTGDKAKNESTLSYDGERDHADYEDKLVSGGNIGVTMTQELIERQREVVTFNIYQHITDEFKRQFCLMVY